MSLRRVVRERCAVMWAEQTPAQQARTSRAWPLLACGLVPLDGVRPSIGKRPRLGRSAVVFGLRGLGKRRIDTALASAAELQGDVIERLGEALSVVYLLHRIEGPPRYPQGLGRDIRARTKPRERRWRRLQLRKRLHPSTSLDALNTLGRALHIHSSFLLAVGADGADDRSCLLAARAFFMFSAIFALPSGVFGPVLSPPWLAQRFLP